MFNYPIAISLSPNTQNDDVWQAFKTLLSPWRFREGNAVYFVKQWFKKYFGVNDVYLFNSGRSALYTLLKALEIGEGDEVLIQAFTCIAVPDPVIWTGAKTIFVDIDDSLNIDPEAIERHINHKTRAIIVQHTFGIPAQISTITKIAQKHNLVLIEDCAHALGATFQGKKLGTFGDFAFFSFGRDKVISSVFGGGLIVNGKRKSESEKIKKIYDKLHYPNYFWIVQQLLHPIAFALILPLYNVILGKLLLFILQKLKLLSKPVYKEEYFGGKPNVFPAKYPNALATLLLIQLAKLVKYNEFRIQTAKIYLNKLKGYRNIKLPVYSDGAIYLRFNILISNAQKLLKTARKHGILLGNWYRKVIDPKGVSYEKIGYRVGSCPNAERIAELSMNLPTYPRLTRDELIKLLNVVKTYGGKRT
jgi:dTDP-4-amino-4,6-dideoxygalactose transaminase